MEKNNSLIVINNLKYFMLILLLCILNFVINEENNLKCVINVVYDFDNKTDIKIIKRYFKINI